MKKIVASMILLVLVVAGCSGMQRDDIGPTATTPPEVSLEGLSVQNYPLVDGSTSALPLQQIIACHVFGLACAWQEAFLFDETRNILPPWETTGPEEELMYLFNLGHSGTHDAYLNLIRGDAEIILVARQPSNDEIRAAKIRGVKLDYRPVALDAFVFLANVANPVESLENPQIKDIYTGQITTWDQLGVDFSVESNRTITTYRRNENSGSQELMESLVMKGEKMIESPDLLLYGMMGPFNAIGSNPLGIGYSVYYYATYMLPTETVRLVQVEGVLPTVDTIADGSYPYVTEVYVVVRGDASPKSSAIQLRNWLLTDEGQAVVAESGYVPAAGGQD